MYVEVDSTFYQQQLAVLHHEVNSIMDTLKDIALRLDEMQSELDDGEFTNKFNQKIGLDTVDDYYPGQPCDCPECRDDRAYRMD